MNGVPCVIHGHSALFLGIVYDDDGHLQAVYTSHPDDGCMFLHMTHPSQVKFVKVVAEPQRPPQADKAKIPLIKLLREGVAEALRIGITDDNGRPYLGLAAAKQMAEKFLNEHWR